MKITKKEFEVVKSEVLAYFKPSIVEAETVTTVLYRYSIETVYGAYLFHFSDNDTIFGRFQDVEKMRSMLPVRYETVNGVMFEVSHYPNVCSGKMNFHFNDIYDFIDTFDRLVLKVA